MVGHVCLCLGELVNISELMLSDKDLHAAGYYPNKSSLQSAQKEVERRVITVHPVLEAPSFFNRSHIPRFYLLNLSLFYKFTNFTKFYKSSQNL